MKAVSVTTTAKWKLVSCDPEKCTGCALCEYVCALVKENAYSHQKARIRTMRFQPSINISVTCRLCEGPPCVAACPRDALRQSEETGEILVDDEKCNGCSLCIEACDFGAITLHPEKKVVRICDLCGGDPECVKWCPEEALDFVRRDLLAQKARFLSISVS